MRLRIFCLFLWGLVPCVEAASTIDVNNHFSYAGNLGWMDWYAGGTNGVVIGEYVCSGSIWIPNCGWISLGSGTPANGIQYQNNSATDFGVNQNGVGDLTGSAYGGNIGWITFEQTYGKPKINLVTGQFSGSVWCANCGWISLSNAIASVQTDRINKGALAANGLPVAWLLLNFGTTNIDANADPTGKGISVRQDYLAGTDPNNKDSILKVTAETILAGGTYSSLTWNSVPNRYYYLQKTTDLTMQVWIDSGLGLISPSSGTTTSGSFTNITDPVMFYRVQAVRPLTP